MNSSGERDRALDPGRGRGGGGGGDRGGRGGGDRGGREDRGESSLVFLFFDGYVRPPLPLPWALPLPWDGSLVKSQ